MDRNTELALIDELLQLHEARSPFLDERVEASPIDRYTDAARFTAEQARIFRGSPLIALHSHELPEPGSFVRRRVAGMPLLFTRDDEGRVRAFVNACRHRGAELVSESAGCRQRFTCPYHAWTYDVAGRLVGVPHERSGFPGLQRETRGLAPVACREALGFVWVSIGSDAVDDLEGFLGPIAEDLAWLDIDAFAPFATLEHEARANWKILVEGGIESYHFKVAHRQTVGPLFQDNLSTYQAFGHHLRSVLPRKSLPDLAAQPRETWEIRPHTNLLYSLMPNNQLLVQEDHVVWIQLEPTAADTTHVRLTTLVPKAEREGPREGYWQANHDFTVATLMEDFEIGEGIQRGLESGANAELLFGRFEGALAAFNASVESLLD